MWSSRRERKKRAKSHWSGWSLKGWLHPKKEPQGSEGCMLAAVEVMDQVGRGDREKRPGQQHWLFGSSGYHKGAGLGQTPGSAPACKTTTGKH